MENKFRFLMKTSLLKKIKNKWFLIANIIVAIVIVGLVNIDSIVSFFGGDFNNDLKISVIDETGYYEIIENNLKNVDKYLSNSKVVIEKNNHDIKEAKKKIKGKDDILIVVKNDEENTFKVDFISDSYVDTVRYQAIVASLNSAKSMIALSKSNIDPNELAKINKQVEVNRVFIDEEKSKEEEDSKFILSIASTVIVLPCFMLIVFLVQMIGAEINEEKSTRGMEIIIGNVSPKAHFFAKVLSSNVFVLIQGILLLLYSGIGLIVRKFTTSSSNLVSNATSMMDFSEIIKILKEGGIVDKLGYVIPLVLILLLLSFLAYSLLAGILASMTTNMENYQQLQTPLMIISVIGFYLIFISTAFPGATFIKVVSCIPLISISLAPSLFLSGEIGVGILIIAILLLIILNYVLIKYGLKIYKVGILNYSETDLWKKMFKAVKEK